MRRTCGGKWTRLGVSLSADRQYVWGRRYTDDLVLRDRNADGLPASGNLGLAGSGLEEWLYALQDANWNVVALIGTDGAAVERYTYTGYGEPSVQTPGFAARATSGYAWDSLDTGRQLDVETGLYHYRHRYYSAELGRFVNRDPLEYRAGDANLYRYVKNRPISATDPKGLVERVGTGVYTCQAKQYDSILFQITDLLHSFLKIDGVGYGLFEVNGNAIGTARVRNDDLTMYPEHNELFPKLKSGDFYSRCQEIVVNPCCWDPKKFKAAALSFISAAKGANDTYVAGFWGCRQFVIAATAYAFRNSHVANPSWYCYIAYALESPPILPWSISELLVD